MDGMRKERRFESYLGFCLGIMIALFHIEGMESRVQNSVHIVVRRIAGKGSGF